MWGEHPVGASVISSESTRHSSSSGSEFSQVTGTCRDAALSTVRARLPMYGASLTKVLCELLIAPAPLAVFAGDAAHPDRVCRCRRLVKIDPLPVVVG